jgi:hypothetical protein
MSWTYTGNILSATSTGNKLSDCAGDSIPSSGSPSMQTLNSDHKCYFINLFQIDVNTGAEWKEENSIILHKQISTSNAINYDSATSLIQFGLSNLTTSKKPVLYNGCYYIWDMNGSTGTNDNWTTADTVGIFKIFGGQFLVHPMAGGTGGTSSGFVYFPQSQSQFIGVNYDRFGGCRFYGTNFRLQETQIQGGNGYGISVLTSQDAIGVDFLNCQGSESGIYLSSAQPSDSKFVNLAFRKLTKAVVLATYGDGVGRYAEIINSDAVNGIGKLDAFNAWGSNDASIEEKTTFDIKCVNENNTNLQNVNCRIVRTLSGTGYDTVTWGKSTGTGDLIVPKELLMDLTSATGEIDQLLLIRRYFNKAVYTGLEGVPPLNFSGFYITIRKYGYIFEDIAVSPQFGQNKGLIQTYILKSDIAVTESNQTTVDSMTGITINKVTENITISEEHTINEVYDYVHSWLTKDDQMNFETDYDVDGIPATSQITPFQSLDGILYSVIDSWTFTGSSYLDLDGTIFQHPNNDRIVPIELLNIEERSSFTIRTLTGTLLYSGTIDESKSFKTQRLWEQINLDVDIKVRLQGYKSVKISGQIGNNGLIVQVNSEKDLFYQFEKGRLQQTNYRFRNDNGTETTATWKTAENTDITNVTKNVNLRLRVQIKEYEKKDQNITPILQYKKVGNNSWLNLE